MADALVFFQCFCRISITCSILMKPDTNMFGFIVCAYELFEYNKKFIIVIFVRKKYTRARNISENKM